MPGIESNARLTLSGPPNQIAARGPAAPSRSLVVVQKRQHSRSGSDELNQLLLLGTR